MDADKLLYRFGKAMVDRATRISHSCLLNDWCKCVPDNDKHFLVLYTIFSLMENNGSFVDSVFSYSDQKENIFDALSYFKFAEERDLLFDAISVARKIDKSFFGSKKLERERLEIEDKVKISTNRIVDFLLKNADDFSLNINKYR